MDTVEIVDKAKLVQPLPMSDPNNLSNISSKILRVQRKPLSELDSRPTASCGIQLVQRQRSSVPDSLFTSSSGIQPIQPQRLLEPISLSTSSSEEEDERREDGPPKSHSVDQPFKKTLSTTLLKTPLSMPVDQLISVLANGSSRAFQTR